MKDKESSFHLMPPRIPIKRQMPRKLEHSPNASQNHNFETAKEKLRAAYFETLNTVIGEIDSRFFQEGMEVYRHLEASVLTDPEDWTEGVSATLEKYGIDKDSLQAQVKTFHLIPDRYVTFTDLPFNLSSAPLLFLSTFNPNFISFRRSLVIDTKPKK